MQRPIHLTPRRNRRRPFAGTALLAAASLTLAACSGGGSDETDSTTAGTPATSGGSDATVPITTPPDSSPVTSPVTEPTLPPPIPGATGPIPAGQTGANADYQYNVLADGLEGASGSNVADVNDDGFNDLIVVSFGQRPVKPADVEPGTLSVWYQNGDPTTYEQQPLLEEGDGFYFINEPYVGDLDGDGDLDILAGIGFFVCANIGTIGPCGALIEFENTGVSGLQVQWERHDIVPNGFERFFHRPAVADLDADGFVDIVTMGENFDSAETYWIRGGADGFETELRLIGSGGGSFPTITDIDGDGDLDIASGQYFQTPASAVWFENDGALNFTQHVITDAVGKTIQLSLVDGLDGPGTAPVWLVSNHTNTTRPDQKESGVYRLTPGPDPTQPWAVELITTGIQSRETVGTGFQAAPGVFGWGDVDGDGDVDIALSGDGDPRLFVLEQTAPGEFATVTLEEDFGQAGSMRIVDLNNDGANEIVISGYEAYQLRLYNHL